MQLDHRFIFLPPFTLHSGGSWLTGSYYANQGRTIPDLAQNVWNLSSNLIIPDKGFLDTTSYFTDLISEVKGKRDLGFATAIVGPSSPPTPRPP